MTQLYTGAAKLLVENLSLLRDLECGPGVLDLASGSGRNGLYLLAHGIPVTFADRNAESLETARNNAGREARISCVQADLETEEVQTFAGRQFDAVLVFNYLHRPLFSTIKQLVRPGGLIFYETFTTAQRAYGRPRNPDYLLHSGELRDAFEDWRVLHYFEGKLTDPERAVANLIARRA